jgi:hypothetical protein
VRRGEGEKEVRKGEAIRWNKGSKREQRVESLGISVGLYLRVSHGAKSDGYDGYVDTCN